MSGLPPPSPAPRLPAPPPARACPQVAEALRGGTTMARLGVVLVAGDDAAASETLARAIALWKPGDDAETAAVEDRPASSSSPGATDVAWRIDNKYYAADVVLRAAADTTAIGATDPPDALVIAFDATRAASFAAARDAVHAAGEAYLDAIEVRLCVAVLPRGEGEASSAVCGLDACHNDNKSWLARCYDWCCEQCFEYVEAQPQDAARDASLTLFDEPQGVARVVEVLHCHQWPNGEAKGGGVGGEIESSSAATSPAPANIAEEDATEDALASVESLFSKLAAAREQSSRLPDGERRMLAENTLDALLEALGEE